MLADDSTLLDALDVIAWIPLVPEKSSRFCSACASDLDPSLLPSLHCSCRELCYCSEECKAKSTRGHWLVCGGGRLVREFKRALGKKSSLVRLVAQVLLVLVERAVQNGGSSSDLRGSLEKEMMVFTGLFPDRIAVQGLLNSGTTPDSDAAEADDGDAVDDDDELSALEETLTLLRGVIRHETSPSRPDLPTLADALCSVDLRQWTKLYLLCKVHSVTLFLPSILQAKAKDLILERNVAVKQEGYNKLCAALEIDPSQPTRSTAAAAVVGDLPLPPATNDSENVTSLERRVCHLAQTAGAPGETVFSKHCFSALALVSMSPPDEASQSDNTIRPVKHCCSPSAALEAYIDVPSHQLKCRLVATRCIDLTVEAVSRRYNYLPLSGPGGASACQCFHCEISRAGVAGAGRLLDEQQQEHQQQEHQQQEHQQQQPKTSESSKTSERVYSLIKIAAFTALAEQDPRALGLLKVLVRAAGSASVGGGEKEGDVHHAYGAALLAKGSWQEAHAAWDAGHAIFPHHTGLKEAVARTRAFRFDDDDVARQQQTRQLAPAECWVLRQSTSPAAPAIIFLTKQPLLSEEDCHWCISQAETFASLSSTGWTTARHYAVPTTDIPLTSLPPVLDWLKSLVFGRLRDSLASLFFPSATSGRVRMCIHDAFLVKYSVGPTSSSEGESPGQTHLPLHQDESTHSLIISLSSDADYSGGGTYFQLLDCAIRPRKGQVLAFNGGSLVHGGDPIVSGVRYVIAAFLMLEEGGEDTARNDDGEKQASKCRRIEPPAAGGAAFSFGFF